jgi:tRNA threonylcarbamoyladenosine biosynthesis protein TsaE
MNFREIVFLRETFTTKFQLEAWAKEFASNFTRPCLILLDGEMGAGKTQMVRWFCAGLGVSDTTSPTFAIHNEYRSNTGPVDHVDLYRVQSDADLENSGFWDLLQGESRLLFVEWAERLPAEVWPAKWMRVDLRLIKFPGSEEARVLEWSIRT